MYMNWSYLKFKSPTQLDKSKAYIFYTFEIICMIAIRKSLQLSVLAMILIILTIKKKIRKMK